MSILKNKFDEIISIIKNDDDNIEHIKEILQIASMNFLEEDIEEIIDSYGNILRDYINTNRIQYKNKKLMLPVKTSIMINKNFDYKVFIILKLLANNKQNDRVTKFALRYNKDKILNKYNVTERVFLKGFENLISLGILIEEETYYKIDLKKNEGYYLALDRNICDVIVKENVRTIKTYIFMRDYLRNKTDLFENARGAINYGVINYGTGYKDRKSLKIIIDRLLYLELVERTQIRISDLKNTYEYEIISSTMFDYFID